MKQLAVILLSMIIALGVQGQQSRRISGKIISAITQEPLQGASVKIKGGNAGTITDANGAFTLSILQGSPVLVVSFIGYQSREIMVPENQTESLTITLHQNTAYLDEVVVSTGYYQIPRERATGSFTYIDNGLLNRSTSSDIISRLEGVTSGLLFDRRGEGVTASSSVLQLRVRGISTIQGNESPLIVVNNFPYEGNLQNINPNDVESITLLKDAAAASIWGARAGNGVIVITTKRGQFNQPLTVSFNSSAALQKKPDLYYDPGFLSSAPFIKAEKTLFDRGFYDADISSVNYPVLSPVVELLAKEREGLILATEVGKLLAKWENEDIRRDAEKYLYRNGIHQQYAFNIQGGASRLRYYFSGGYDNELTNKVGNKRERFTLTTTNTYRPFDKMEITASMAYVQSKSDINSLDLHTITPGSGKTIYPYAQLADENGKPLATAKDYSSEFVTTDDENLMDWQYRPLDELQLRNNVIKDTEVRINTGIRYSLPGNLNAEIKYAFKRSARQIRHVEDANSYAVRNLVNAFTQDDGTTIFPPGDILYNQQEEYVVHSGRLQLSYNKQINRLHQLSAVAGIELRQATTEGNAFELFGYDDNILTFQQQFDFDSRYPIRPRGTARLPLPLSSLTSLLDRFFSYYTNISYSYQNRYTISASARKDASNLFGVNTNQKGVPLWSAGLGWNLSQEDFYVWEAVPYLKLRATYGYNGNVDRSLTAFTTAIYRSDLLTGFRAARINSPGNPELRWEKVGIWNIGLDFESKMGRLKGSLEYFVKDGKDLIGNVPIDPTTGYLDSYKLNRAELRTYGFDFDLSTFNVDQGFKWRTDILLSYAKDKVIQYELEDIDADDFFNTLDNIIQVGKPLHGAYSYPWLGLDPTTGDPLVKVENETSKDYSTFVREMTPDDLIYHGVSLPPYLGSIRNTFSWNGFDLSFNITGKFGYFFRRSSINYRDFFDDWKGHRDFEDRWQKPGDETVTQVPSMPESTDTYRGLTYLRSELLVENGDHIRLQDINLSYTFDPEYLKQTPLKQLRLFFYARNLGILWQASKENLDPDYPFARFAPVATFSLGINARF